MRGCLDDKVIHWVMLVPPLQTSATLCNLLLYCCCPQMSPLSSLTPMLLHGMPTWEVRGSIESHLYHQTRTGSAVTLGTNRALKAETNKQTGEGSQLSCTNSIKLVEPA